MKTYNEWVETKSKGLFEAMNDIETLAWNEFVSPEGTDNIFQALHGNKPITSNITNSNITKVANEIMLLYNRKWKDIYEAKTRMLPIGIEHQTTIKANIEDSGQFVDDNERINKESAYNSDSFINSDGTTTKTQSESDNTKKEDRDVSYSSLQAFKEGVELIQSDVLIAYVFHDVRTHLLLQIY